jgi:methionyl-tRNA synthetase
VDTFFLTGTDEHGVNVERSAVAAGRDPQSWADEVALKFKNSFDHIGISYDDFIRTTEERHTRGVQQLFRVLRDRGFIYKGTYTGQYCIFDNLYVDVNQPGAPCPECGRPTETISEQNYFFKLSAFKDKLLQLYDRWPPGLFVWPEVRRNEVTSFVRGGLRDLSISRSTFKWGVPVPDDPGHVVYVWLDALSNYITAIGYGSPDPADQRRFQHYWPADIQMIGKEIIRFHCVYWPAFLMAADIPLPKSIIVHGHLLFEESKMSKSRGNVVRAETIVDVLGADALRYFLLREVVFGQDGSFSFDALVGRFNSDLANDLGNLASRTLTMITKYFRGEVPYPSGTAARTPADDAIASLGTQTIALYTAMFDTWQFSRALETAWALVGAVNKYIVENEPWAVAEKNDEGSLGRLATILYTTAEALRIVTALAHPVIPEATAKIWSQLGLGEIAATRLDQLKWGQLPLGARVSKVEGVFPRADKNTVERMQQMEEQERPASSGSPAAQSSPAKPNAVQPNAAHSNAVHSDAAKSGAASSATSPADSGKGGDTAPAQAATAAPGAGAKISIDDFTKVELRVGQVKFAEKVKGADRLLRLEVDIGTEVRQVVAGIALAYEPESLIGRKVVMVVNLAPRKLRGLESNGMIVAASVGEEGKPVLAGFLEDVPVGAKLK